MLQKHFASSPNSKKKNKLYDVNSNLEQYIAEGIVQIIKKITLHRGKEITSTLE